ncbi:winged helix-turn-helix transcriptional regulator [Marinactinospora rubrisoli]|uniref:Winged helix-turn-helix transcriptional regulator n=1 Tax=Marinactinospora rubrisoli TaxID=2715399 RepID=A0ABW2KC99_9ACTN
MRPGRPSRRRPARAGSSARAAAQQLLRRRSEGVTQRVLTQAPRRLGRNGMIQRKALPTSPVGVGYSLTALGESLRGPFKRLYTWTVEHSEEIQNAQRAYDNRADA